MLEQKSYVKKIIEENLSKTLLKILKTMKNNEHSEYTINLDEFIKYEQKQHHEFETNSEIIYNVRILVK